MEPIKFTLKSKADIERKRLDLEVRSLIIPFDLSYLSEEEYFWVKVDIRKKYLEILAKKMPPDYVQELRKLPEFDAYFEQILSVSDRDLVTRSPVFYSVEQYIEDSLEILQHMYPNRPLLEFIGQETPVS